MTRASLLDALPDAPRWIETRALVRRPSSPLFVDPTAPPPAFAVVDPVEALAAVAGEPAPGLIRRAATLADELLAVPENVRRVREALPEWGVECARVHTLAREAQRGPSHPVRLLERGEVGALDLPGDLADDLRIADRRGAPIAAALDGPAPVAFVYPSAESETLWDVAIDTLPTHRRRGFAWAAAVWMIDRMAGRGKAVVWCAAASNRASLGLAARIGFVEVDAIWLFTRPEAG